MQKIEAAQIIGDSVSWNSFSNQFRQQICSFEEKKVCCCHDNQREESTPPKLNGNFESLRIKYKINQICIKV